MRASFGDEMARRAFDFFWNESHPTTGLTKDRAHNVGEPDSYTVASVASTGYALATLVVGVRENWVSRAEAQKRALLTLRFVSDDLPHDHGFCYHFIDWASGARVWNCELSSIDSSLLVLGALAAGRFFGGECAERADRLLARMDWPWMQNDPAGADGSRRAPSMGHKPDSGFLSARWQGYSEALYLYLLALAGPKTPLPKAAWDAWSFPTSVLFEGQKVFGGPTPIFFAQMAPGFFDLKGRRDSLGRDWHTNFVAAHRGHVAYCAKKASTYSTYDGGVFGINACDQPPPVGYGAQEPIDGRNDGTVAPTAILAATAFVPDAANKALATVSTRWKEKIWGRYGCSNAFNADKNWFDPDVIGIDLGMAILLWESRRGDIVRKTLASHPDIGRGLTRAGLRRR